MSIASELTNLESNIGDAYDAVNDMSGIIPQHKNMANLDQAIRTIPQNAGTTYTAGNGINIDANNEISIDDTVVAELSDIPGVMTGASSSVAGASGLVPAPAMGDQDKVLKGDGTWGAVDAATTTFYVDNLAEGTRTIYSDRDFTNAVSGNTIKTAFENGRVRIMYTPMSLFSYDEYELVGIGDIHDTPTTGGTFILSGANNTISLCYSYQSFASTSATLTKKTIPTVNDATLTIQHNGTTVQTFTANQSTAATANIETIWADDAIPTTQVPPVTTSMIDDEAVTAAKVCGGTSGDTLANGALVEVVGTTTGNSANYAWKYADGRLINFQHYELSGNATTSWGSMYSGVQMTPRNYAVAFTATPIVMAQLDWTTATGNCWLAQANEKGSSTTTHPGGYQLVRPTSQSGLNTGVSIVAYGFWK